MAKCCPLITLGSNVASIHSRYSCLSLTRPGTSAFSNTPHSLGSGSVISVAGNTAMSLTT